MKELCDVIEARACCNDYIGGAGCQSCPYFEVNNCTVELEEDTMHYLKRLEFLEKPRKDEQPELPLPGMKYDEPHIYIKCDIPENPVVQKEIRTWRWMMKRYDRDIQPDEVVDVEIEFEPVGGLRACLDKYGILLSKPIEEYLKIDPDGLTERFKECVPYQEFAKLVNDILDSIEWYLGQENKQ